MRRFLLSVAAIACFAGIASATPVQYETFGELCIGGTGCGNTSITINNTVLSYARLTPAATVNAAPITGANFGALVVSCVGGGTACAAETLPTNLVLNITVSQTIPFVDTGDINLASVTGRVGGLSATAMVNWVVSNSATLTGPGASSKYTISNNPLNLVPASSNNGRTTIQGNVLVETSPVPEPATYAMLASGLLGLGFFARRRSSR